MKAWFALVALLMFPLVACGDDDTADLVAPVAIHDGTWNYDDALIEGKLVEEDGCLVLVDAGQGTGRVLPAFADDRVIWDPPSHVLTVYGKEFRPGTRVSFGGSGWPTATLPPGVSWVNGPPTSCRYDMIWGVNPPQ